MIVKVLYAKRSWRNKIENKINLYNHVSCSNKLLKNMNKLIEILAFVKAKMLLLSPYEITF